MPWPPPVTMGRRSVREADLAECLALHPPAMGHELIGRNRAVHVWRTLLEHPSCNFVIIEFKEPTPGCKTAGFGASAFVSRAFVEEEISRPRPGLNARIMASIAAGAPVVLTETELRHANTYDGLHLVILCAAWKRNQLTDAQVQEVKMHLSSSFLQDHAGYRFAQILFETTDQVDIDHAHSTGVYRVVSDFENYHKCNPGAWNRDRALFTLDRESALSITGTVATILFHHTEPLLGLRKEDQQLLTAALTGLTDEELCERLKFQLGTLKKRWAALYQRVAKTRPDLLNELDDGLNRLTRGRQKRHHLLGYVREHPEELRPILPHRSRIGDSPLTSWRGGRRR